MTQENLWGKLNDPKATGAKTNLGVDPLSMEEAKPKFTDDDVKGWIDHAAKTPVKSVLCCVLYGEDGSAKSGVAMDCRTPEEIKDGWKIYDLDFDGSGSPLKQQYYKNDPNIIILDPTVLNEKGEIDYPETYQKTCAIVRYLIRVESMEKVKAVILDGLDTLLKICEYVMRQEDLKIDPNTQITDQWQWSKRNRRYLTPVILLKRLNCDRFYTTHMKEIKKYKDVGEGKEKHRELVVVDTKPDWEKSTPGIMFQKVFLERKSTAVGVEFVAKIEKCKTNVALEGKTYTVAEVTPQGSKWYGMKEFFEAAKQPMTEEQLKGLEVAENVANGVKA